MARGQDPRRPATAPAAVLVGPPGAGKTTVGRRLARALGVAFADTDEMIEDRTGRACGEVYADLGEEAFRVLEAEVVEAALAGEGILALGGGAVVTPATRELLTRHTVVHLDVSVAEGVRRTARGGHRPILAGTDPEARYRELLGRRRPLYDEVADFRVRSDERSPQRVVAQILSFLETDGDDGA